MPHMPKLFKKFSEKNLRNRSLSQSSISAEELAQLRAQSEPPPPLPIKESSQDGVRPPWVTHQPPVVPSPLGTLNNTTGEYGSTNSFPNPYENNEHVSNTQFLPPIPAASPLSMLPSQVSNGTSAPASQHSRTASVPRPLPAMATNPVPGVLVPGAQTVIQDKVQEKKSAEDEDYLGATWAVATKELKGPSKTDKVLQKIENTITSAQGAQEQGTKVVSMIKTGLEAAGSLEVVTTNLNSLMEGSNLLMKALDDVAKIHPFIGVAVLAFKTVWTLEMKRRENDKKIIVLYGEMKDMMGVLISLKTVKDPDEVAPDGSTIKSRMEALSKGTADDIKSCGNTCDAYSKKKLLVKVINSNSWNEKLAKFSVQFQNRKKEFEFALAIHTAKGVDQANDKLNDLERINQDMNTKMEQMMNMFKQLVSPDQKMMAALVDQKGGAKAVLQNKSKLQELQEKEAKNTSGSGGSRNMSSKSEMDELMEELRTDPNVAVTENLKVFERKFDVQQQQLKEELERIMKREGDRIIGAITSGPHDRIVDPDVYKIWKEMGWRGSVKTKHFVMALHDYFFEKWHKGNSQNDGTLTVPGNDAPVSAIDKEDEWALEYLTVTRLQAISEAFDDDASGFITVQEVNSFTTARPLGWTLPHWIAYWAIGWYMTLKEYSTKIDENIGKLFALLPAVKLENQTAANTYMSEVYKRIATIYKSLNPGYVNQNVKSRFISYVQEEEARLRRNLEAVRYSIDAKDTLSLVTGPGRIEKFMLPVIWLLLERHLDIFKVAQKHVLNADELWEAYDTILYVFDEIDERLENLKSIFKQQNLDEGQQLKSFAYGIFEYHNDGNQLWSLENIRKSDPPDYPYPIEEEDIDPTKVCNLLPVDAPILDLDAYERPIPVTPTTSTPEKPISEMVKAFLGTWNGYVYDGTIPYDGMTTLIFTPGSGENEIQASGLANDGQFTVSGTCSMDDSDPNFIGVSLKWTMTEDLDNYWKGRLDLQKGTISGNVTFEEDSDDSDDESDHKSDHTKNDSDGSDDGSDEHTFFLTRASPEIIRFRPALEVFQKNKTRALWTFATSAIRDQVAQRAWSRSRFQNRIDIRKRFITLKLRHEFGTPLSSREQRELSKIRGSFTAADSRFYHSLVILHTRKTLLHNIQCKSCEGWIGGACILCLDCATEESVGLCDNPSCIEEEVVIDGLEEPHLPTHTLVKVRRVVHISHKGLLSRQAFAALQTARKKLSGEPGDEKGRGSSKEDYGDESSTGSEDGDDDGTENNEDGSQGSDGGSQSGSADESDFDSTDENEENAGGKTALKSASVKEAVEPAVPLNIRAPVVVPDTEIHKEEEGAPDAKVEIKCVFCKKAVIQPCWYCINCEDSSSFICSDCELLEPEAALLTEYQGTHQRSSHDLVRCIEPPQDGRMTSVEDRLEGLEKRFTEHEGAMTERLARLELLLQAMAATMGVKV